MSLRPEHELHDRRRGRNLGLLVVLVFFVTLVFALSIVKISNGNLMEGFDHKPRTSLLPIGQDGEPDMPAATGASSDLSGGTK